MVLDINTPPNDIQYLSKDGIVMPWYVKGALDYLESIDMSNKIVWEYGLGLSTCWYAHVAKKVDGVDTNLDWFRNVQETLLHHNLLNTQLKYVSEVREENYVLPPSEVKKYDLIVIDGQLRDETALSALINAKQGTIVVIDNYCQPEVYMPTQEVQDEVNKHNPTLYYSENSNHLDWCTCILTIQ